MINYDVEAIADELLLTTEELKEVFSFYFEDAERLVTDCQAAIARTDYNEIGKVMHALKGASLNLRMQSLGKLAADVEGLAKQKAETALPAYLPKIKSEIAVIKAQISTFYVEMDKI